MKEVANKSEILISDVNVIFITSHRNLLFRLCSHVSKNIEERQCTQRDDDQATQLPKGMGVGSAEHGDLGATFGGTIGVASRN